MGRAASVSGAAGRLARSCMMPDDVSRLRYAARFLKMKSAPLSRLSIVHVRDLLLHIPSRYNDYSHVCPIALADVGTEVTVVATVDAVSLKTPRPHFQLVEVFVIDATGVMKLTFFRQPWIANQLSEGDTIAVSGKVGFASGFKQMTPANWEHIEKGMASSELARIMPTYAIAEGIGVGWMRRLISAALYDVGDVCDFLPASLVADRKLPTLARALRDVHFPPTLPAAELARRRLAYDELLCLQLALLCRRNIELAGAEAIAHTVDGPHLRAATAALPFRLTPEQQRAVKDVLGDMASPHTMNRLLLGDVGTGKTVVAALALAAVADSGTQAALMAPTSVLVDQYAEKVGPLLDAAHVSWSLVTGFTPSAERQRTAQALSAGSCTVVFGTTALLSRDIVFRRLSLIVVDEQHRFGVDQRAALRGKGVGADLLAMTATPIPRTLALAFYGDMQCSRIRHRPIKGAGVTTNTVVPENEDLALHAIEQALEAGHQAYVVCPLVDDADEGEDLDDVPEASQAKAAHMHSVATTQQDMARRFPHARVAALTGKMTAAEKAGVMDKFRRGKVQVLVCTTVIEVGIDVANATTMIIYDADRFGLATLHQLRGRVGRGTVPGNVWLVCAARKGTVARRRLEALESSSDGFELAELDLRLRHEGDVLGYRQHGGAVLRISDLDGDADLVEWAHKDALRIASTDPELSLAEHQPLAFEVRDRFGAYFEEVEHA